MNEWLNVAPIVNTILLLSLIGLIVFILHASRQWTGISHDNRLTALEDDAERYERRITLLESNSHRLGTDVGLSIGKLSSEVKAMGDHIHDLKYQLGQFESRFSRMGCGYPECPRIIESKEG